MYIHFKLIHNFCDGKLNIILQHFLFQFILHKLARQTLIMSTKTPILLAIGDPNEFKTIFNKINHVCSNTINKIQIKENNQEGGNKSWDLEIATKYYDYSLNIKFLSFESTENVMKSILEQLLNEENSLVEAVFVLLSGSNDESNFEILSKSLSSIENVERCFNVLLYQDGRCENIDSLANKLPEPFLCIRLDSSEQQPKDSNEMSKDEEEMEESGFDELINCLYVHEWQSMRLKSEEKVKTQAAVKQEESSKTEAKTENITASASKEKESASNEEKLADDFESLLTNLSEMRNKAASMSEEERKKYAEDVVKKFWKAIGGDEEDL